MPLAELNFSHIHRFSDLEPVDVNEQCQVLPDHKAVQVKSYEHCVSSHLNDESRKDSTRT